MLNRRMYEVLEKEIVNYIDIIKNEREIIYSLWRETDRLREENEMLRMEIDNLEYKIEMLKDGDKVGEDK